MRDDIEKINRILRDMLEDMQSGIFANIGFDYKSFAGGMKGQNTVDPYRVLGLDKSASDDEVKTRYRERLRQFHPDTAGPGMEYHLQAVMAAYEMIRRERGWH